MTLTEKKRNLYKMLLTEVSTQLDLHGAVATEFLADIDALFNAYERSQQVVPYTHKQKIFDLLVQWDNLSAYDQNFVLGVSKYYGTGTQTRRQENYLDRLWREMQKRETPIELEDSFWPGCDPVDLSDGPVR